VDVEFNVMLQGFEHHGVDLLNNKVNFDEKIKRDLTRDFI